MIRPAFLAVYLVLLPWGAPAPGPPKSPPAPLLQRGESVKTTWYGHYRPGRRTASGELFDLRAPACAHRTLPLGTVLRLRNPANGKTATVRVNDRGPAAWTGKDLDVTLGVARLLDFERAGVAEIEMRVLGAVGAAPSPRKTVRAGGGAPAKGITCR